jgi:hypothetical protein
LTGNQGADFQRSTKTKVEYQYPFLFFCQQNKASSQKVPKVVTPASAFAGLDSGGSPEYLGKTGFPLEFIRPPEAGKPQADRNDRKRRFSTFYEFI